VGGGIGVLVVLADGVDAQGGYAGGGEETLEGGGLEFGYSAGASEASRGRGGGGGGGGGLGGGTAGGGQRVEAGGRGG